MFDEKSYLVIISVSNEREPRFAIMKSRIDAFEYIEKLKRYIEEKGVAKVVAKVFDMGEPVEVVA